MMRFGDLLKIMHRLREKCPWDASQTRESLKPFLIEECYEVIEAIEEKEPEKIKEELGDLLFQIIFHAEIAKERGEFDIYDVIDSIGLKMKRRHPHVFGTLRVSTAQEVKALWDEHKRAEGKQKDSVLEGVPSAMPSLLRARKLQERAAKVGFDWKKLQEAEAKLEEELKEFKSAIKKKSKKEIEEELGDIFFMLVNISRFLKVDPEDALRKTITKFIHRFRYIESTAKERGISLRDMTLKEMDALWEEAKHSEKD